MSKRGKTLLTSSRILLFVPIPLLSFVNVHSYIDPGTASLIIQIVIASLVGGIFMLKTFWVKVKLIISKLVSKIRR